MLVVTSARRDRLVDTPTGYRRRLVFGSRCLRVAVVLALPLVYPGVAVGCIALWCLTGRQPGRAEPTAERRTRLAARWLGGLGGAGIVLLSLGALIALSTGRQHLFGDWNYKGLPVFDFLLLMSFAGWVLGQLSAWRHLRILAERVPDDDLARRFRRLGLGWLLFVPVIAGLFAVAYLLKLVDVFPSIAGSSAFGMEAVPMMFILLVVLWIATLRVVTRQVGVVQALVEPTDPGGGRGAESG